ncbi:MAG TPA: hypothetical protein VI318_07610 [Baekduia sp.]
MASKTCCRSCPRCNDCPVLIAARTRGLRRDEQQQSLVSTLVEDVLVGGRFTRSLPDSVTRTLEALDAARRGDRDTAIAA